MLSSLLQRTPSVLRSLLLCHIQHQPVHLYHDRQILSVGQGIGFAAGTSLHLVRLDKFHERIDKLAMLTQHFCPYGQVLRRNQVMPVFVEPFDFRAQTRIARAFRCHCRVAN